MSDNIIKQKLMMFFPTCECERPIIYHLVKDHNLIVNVFRAKVTPDENGHLVLDVEGTQGNIDKAIEWVKSLGVVVNKSGKGVTRDDDKCTHCGICVTHCPTHALRIENTATREVIFDDSACIECLACIRVCPFGACKSAF